MKHSRRRILPLALLAAATTLALTACNGNASGNISAGGSAPASGSASAPAAASASAPASGPATPSSPAQPSKSAAPHSSGSAAAPTTAPGAAGTSATSDSYAYKHPCTGGQLTVKASYDSALGVTKRLIEVTNTGSASCGLTYYPTVAIDNSATINTTSGTPETVQPAVPGGLGGPPYFPIYAGAHAYAVVDLDPSHATSGASKQYNTLSVIATTELPDADTVNTTITEEGSGGGNPYVKSPFLGLYRSTVADAVSSANPANG